MVRRGFTVLLILLATVVLVGCNSQDGRPFQGLGKLTTLFSKQPDPTTLSPEMQVRNFVLAIQEKNYQSAREVLSKSAQRLYTSERLEQTSISQGKFAVIKSEQKEKGINGVRVLVSYKFVNKDDSEDYQVAELVREDGIWKVIYFGPSNF